MARTPKITIVGGGPAGASMAVYLCDAGIAPEDVRILDRATFPRPKLCGGGVTFRGTKLLRELLPADPIPVDGVRSVGLDFRCALGSFPIREAGDQWVFDRATLDHALLSAAIERGVDVRFAIGVRAVRSTADGFVLDTNEGLQRAEWLVGADGARGVVGRSLGLRGGRVGRLVEAVYEPTPRAQPTPSRLLFDFDPILEGIPGYGWVFPATEAGLYKLGVMDGRGICSGTQLRRWTDRFAHSLGYRRVERKIAGWPEHYYAPRSQAHRPGAILVGEAWGIDPLLGEGIAPAIEMARYAAPRLAEAVRRGKRTIRRYEAAFAQSTPGRNLRFQYALAELLYGPSPHRWLRVLFEHRYMRTLAAGGEASYGELAKHLPRLLFHYLAQVAMDGIPGANPIEPELERRGRIAQGRRTP